MPLARMDWASSSRRSRENMRRGWSGLGSIRSTSRNCASSGTILDSAAVGVAAGAGGGGAWVRLARRALRPLPSTLRGFSALFMIQNLFCELNVAFGAFGAGVVAEDRFAEAGGFREANA